MKLFCFPYAGGSAIMYAKWHTYIRSGIEIVPIELAARGTRMDEAVYKTFNEIIEDVLSQIIDVIRSSEYALFGHSLGGKIAYELARKINEKGLPNPKHVFFSGRGAPYVAGKNEKKYSKMSDEEFREEILELGGTPPELFKSPDLLEVFMPILRNDFNLAESELNGKILAPFPFDISIFLGKEEDLTSDQIAGWKNFTTGNCAIYFFNGGHFFINDETEAIVQIVDKTIYGLSEYMK